MQTLVDSSTKYRPRIRNETKEFAPRVETAVAAQQLSLESGNARLAATRLATALMTEHAALSRSFKQGNKVHHS